jgi:2-polyprenyl-3-methyl-5-hydroxy-6-metoxy-1,4-benzoquinol methylase
MSYHQKWLDKKIIDKKIPDYKRVGWNSRNSQIIRMKILSEIVESGNSVLDVGCGMGKFHGYLLEKGISHRYTGIDLIKENIEEAEINYPDGSKFINISLEDFSKFNPSEEYDIVVESGIFAFIPKEEAKNIFSTMNRLSRVSMGCNFLSTLGGFDDGDSIYWNPAEVIPWCEGTLFSIDHSYLPHDFTVFIFKESNI